MPPQMSIDGSYELDEMLGDSGLQISFTEVFRASGVSTLEADEFSPPRAQSMQSSLSIDEFECPVCLDLLCEPLRLPCSHTFCRSCLKVCARYRRKCPMC